ncbi:MAG TPA: peptide-N-glycosidase F-related protein [Chitinophaga sp.]|uniref:peptide-N-glycosidase F-related protein n=1 Tax=Chitinophaga sp. TaxID=1869181 RepID=UPI002C6742F7|nr:peptide-N-glycosidase F-related protein [Chitinophaga sp.]HVI43938.1 peptide-N-glycosidase F-related protein [Chitinophaga sp.]
MKKQLTFFCLLAGVLGFYACTKSNPEIIGDPTGGLIPAKAPITQNVTIRAFDKEPIANAAVVSKKFKFPDTTANIKKILLHVYLNCPSGGCPPWDVYANIRLIHSNGDTSRTLGYELGRWITPYGKDNSSITGGWIIDVTDFRSLLIGNVTLQTRAEVYSGTWLVTTDFEFIAGAPDYAYSAVAPVMEYCDWSTGGSPVTFGKGTVSTNIYNGKQTGFSVKVPADVQKTSFRTTISGWGHAQPYAPGGRGFAEWAFRKHTIKIDDANTFTHDMGSLGCSVNPRVVKNQGGNWTGDRAGWCPGMEVPVRTDLLADAKAGKTFNFNYVLQEDGWNTSNMAEKWRDNGVNTAGAYYAVSTYVVVQSDKPITAPVVANR